MKKTEQLQHFDEQTNSKRKNAYFYPVKVSSGLQFFWSIDFS